MILQSIDASKYWYFTVLILQSIDTSKYRYFKVLILHSIDSFDTKYWQILINCRCEDESDCQGQSNAIVHSSPDPKTNVTALWAPPSNMNGQEVTFVATIVERNDDKGSFWYENISTLPIAV